MTALVFWTLMIAILTAVACALCGVFLVVKREAFVSEGLSHAVLPGIIVAFIIFQDRSSPWLIIAAGLTGLLMVWLVQLVFKTRLVDQDAALGIVFSGLFSIGVILSRLNLKDIHFHAHCIIDGDLNLAPLKGFQVGDWYLGPKAFVVMVVVVLVLVAFITLFYKELKLMAFDESTSKTLGFRPSILHSVWLGLVSITAVAAFETAGTILVVALMIAPAAAANLLTKRLSVMFLFSSMIAIVAASLGIWLGLNLEISPAGPISSIAGLLFLLVVLFAPGNGIISKWQNRRSQTRILMQSLVLQLVGSERGISRSQIVDRIACPSGSVVQALKKCEATGLIACEGKTLRLTDRGTNAINPFKSA